MIDPNNHNYDRAQTIALQLESMASQVVQDKVALWNGDILCEGSPCIMRRLVTSTWGYNKWTVCRPHPKSDQQSCLVLSTYVPMETLVSVK